MDAFPAVLPESQISLIGTEAMERLTEAEVCALASHEAAAFLSVFVRFEGALNEFLSREVRTATDTNPRSPYLLQVVEEEARHSRMFARAIEALGVGWYPRCGIMGIAESTALWFVLRWRPLFYQAMLAVECITDAVLASVHEESKNEVLRTVARIHRVEEARHIDFACGEVIREVRAASAPTRALLAILGPLLAYLIFELLVPPAIYVRSGVASTRLDSWKLWRERQKAEANRARRSRCVARFHAVLRDAGIATGLAGLMWKRIQYRP